MKITCWSHCTHGCDSLSICSLACLPVHLFFFAQGHTLMFLFPKKCENYIHTHVNDPMYIYGLCGLYSFCLLISVMNLGRVGKEADTAGVMAAGSVPSVKCPTATTKHNKRRRRQDYMSSLFLKVPQMSSLLPCAQGFP